MKVSYRTTKLRKQCANAKSRQKAFGTERARRLARRLTALEAADNLGDLKNTPGRLHALTGDRAGQLSLDLDGPFRLILEPVTDQDEAFNCADTATWHRINHVRVVGIEDTHE
jgi:proteic killer suppression protein